MEEKIIDYLIEELSKKEEELVSKSNSLNKSFNKISSNPFKAAYFNLEKGIPHQIEGLIIMDRLNLLVGIKNSLGGTKKTDDLFKRALSLTSKNYKLTKEGLNSIKKLLEILEEKSKR